MKCERCQQDFLPQAGFLKEFSERGMELLRICRSLPD